MTGALFPFLITGILMFGILTIGSMPPNPMQLRR